MSCDECTPWHASWSELVGHTGDRYGSLTDGRAIGYAVTMLRSHVFLCFQTRNSRCPQQVIRRVEKRVENADRSGTGGSSRPKKEQKVATSPLSAETLRPLLKKKVNLRMKDAIGPMIDRMDRQDERIKTCEAA